MKRPGVASLTTSVNLPRRDKSGQATTWILFLRRIHAFVLVALATSWSAWDNLRHSGGAAKFWAVAIPAAFVAYGGSYCLDRAFVGKAWTFADTVRLAFWRTSSPAAALALASVGLDALGSRRLSGVVWLMLAAFLAVFGTLRLRLAEGIKLHRVKSGEVYKRAFFLSKETRTPLKRVYVVPAGRGHLTNAYGLRDSIAVTDNYGKFLHGSQIDFVIGHELGHVKAKHGRKRLLSIAATFAALGVLGLAFPALWIKLRPLLDVIVVLGPVILINFLSRRFEYVADQFGAQLVEPEIAIEALNNLYATTRAPRAIDPVTELFMTHPSLTRRIQAIRSSARSNSKNRLPVCT